MQSTVRHLSRTEAESFQELTLLPIPTTKTANHLSVLYLLPPASSPVAEQLAPNFSIPSLFNMSHLQYFAYPGAGVDKRKNFKYSQAVRVRDRIECAGQGKCWKKKSPYSGQQPN